MLAVTTFIGKRIHTVGQFFSMHSLLCLNPLIRDKYGVLAEWSNAGVRKAPGIHLQRFESSTRHDDCVATQSWDPEYEGRQRQKGIH